MELLQSVVTVVNAVQSLNHDPPLFASERIPDRSTDYSDVQDLNIFSPITAIGP